MGKLYVGNTFIDLLGELKVGTSNVQKVYAGSTLVFPQPGTTTTTTTTSSSTSTTTSTSTSTSTTSTTTTTPTVFSYSIGYSSGTYGGYATSLDACNACYTTTLPLLTVYSTNALNDGAVLYLDAALTTPFTSTGGYFWASGGIGICYTFTYSTQVDNFTTCVPVTTTTTTSSSTSTTTSTTSSTSTTTSTSTSTSTTTSTSTSTTSTTTTEAPTTTTTTTTELQVRVDWDVREQGSGAVQLIIKDSTNTELVNQESQGTGPINGTVYIPQSKTPYTVTVTVTAGTEVAQYRICNVTNSTEVTLNTNVTTTDTYTVSPTPLQSAVYATYGNTNTPTACPV